MFESQCTSIHAHETPSRNLMITFFCTVYYISKRFGPTTFNYEGAQFCNNKNISSFVASFFLFFGQRYDFNHILSVKSGAVIRKTINWKVVRNRVPREIFKKPMPAFRIVNYSKSRWIPTNFCTNFRMSRKYFVEYFRLFCERLNIFNINLRLAMKKTWIYGFETFKIYLLSFMHRILDFGLNSNERFFQNEDEFGRVSYIWFAFETPIKYQPIKWTLFSEQL